MSEPAVVPEPTVEPTAADPAPDSNVVPITALPENWRDSFIPDDAEDVDKVKNILGRYTDSKSLGKAFIEQHRTLSQRAAQTLPEDPTDEQLTEYRKANGIPETHEGYDLSLDDGLVIGEDDKPMVDNVLQVMHANHVKPETATAIVNAYYKDQQSQIAAIEQKDNDDRAATDAEMRETWGADYQTNKNATMNLVNTMPEALRDDFLNARLPDGTALFNNPLAVQFLAETSKSLNPAATVVPNSSDPRQAITSELASIEKLMADKSSEYWKGPNAERMQARYRELITAQERLTQQS